LFSFIFFLQFEFFTGPFVTIFQKQMPLLDSTKSSTHVTTSKFMSLMKGNVTEKGGKVVRNQGTLGGPAW